MSEIKLIILSHNRPCDIVTHHTINHCSLCVPKSQEKAYKEQKHGLDIITHPDSVVGLSAKIRWVYDKYHEVIMLDDDLDKMIRLYVDKFSDEDNNVDPETAYQIIQANYQMAKKLGVKLFGFSNSPRPVAYNSRKPFKLTGFVQGGCIGFLKGFNMILPDECIAACDYFLSGINAYFHRRAFIDVRYAFTSPKGTFRSKGGTADFRSIETEKQDSQLLKEYFGDAIQLKHDTGVKNIQHRYERILKIPF